jgi:hypothetical protein
MKPLARHARASVIGLFPKRTSLRLGLHLVGCLFVRSLDEEISLISTSDHFGFSPAPSGFMRSPKIVPDCKPSTFLNATY